MQLITILRICSYLFAAIAVGGVAYLLVSFVGIVRWLRTRNAQTANDGFAPPVSILKPLCGADRNMYEGFRSHCMQNYPAFEIIFGVNDESDEAVAEVERLRSEFPHQEVKLVVCPNVLGTNRKVSNLQHMIGHARYDFVLINDSDIHVEPHYLRSVMSPFANERVGLVTALYRANAGRTLASRVESLTVATDFVGGVLSALVVERGLHFAMGSTMAVRRAALEKIGKFSALLDKLADDYELGVLVADAGYELQLANTVVETTLPDYGWQGMLAHQIRWARTIRDKRKGGYLGVVTTFGLPWAVLSAVCASGRLWSLALLALVFTLRAVHAAALCGPVLSDGQSMRRLWLVPLRDFVGLGVWFVSWFGSTVSWRGEKFRLHNGTLTRVS
ncbi:MAG TPA: bacteriohopanetetrol glucosamine biosynthesis glycosyltransferase HpnI [candidate division Zixibacteria bacterium]|nr:bacteriohopanetetrol glucosamine biosynthesis glycosyltransferase HpnI [candidate division Zixibacteria bacterium]